MLQGERFRYVLRYCQVGVDLRVTSKCKFIANELALFEMIHKMMFLKFTQDLRTGPCLEFLMKSCNITSVKMVFVLLET